MIFLGIFEGFETFEVIFQTFEVKFVVFEIFEIILETFEVSGQVFEVIFETLGFLGEVEARHRPNRGRLCTLELVGLRILGLRKIFWVLNERNILHSTLKASMAVFVESSGIVRLKGMRELPWGLPRLSRPEL